MWSEALRKQLKLHHTFQVAGGDRQAESAEEERESARNAAEGSSPPPPCPEGSSAASYATVAKQEELSLLTLQEKAENPWAEETLVWV